MLGFENRKKQCQVQSHNKCENDFKHKPCDDLHDHVIRKQTSVFSGFPLSSQDRTNVESDRMYRDHNPVIYTHLHCEFTSKTRVYTI